jgi:cyanuric acid amidohydrolase
MELVTAAGADHSPAMTTLRHARVHRLPAASPDDASALLAAIDAGTVDPHRIVAVLGKTEGNGCVNDFSRGFATQALKMAIAGRCGEDPDSVYRRVAFVMSGGTEGGLSPHWLVFEVHDGRPASGLSPSLAIGTASTPVFRPEQLGRMAQVEATAAAVRSAMAQAGIASAADVHYVQVKCPLLTKARIAEAAARGHGVATEDTYLSMGYSRGASALGVAIALGEIDPGRVNDASVCHDDSLWSGRASTSAGIELMENQVMVLGNSASWCGDLVIGHGVMQDAIDVHAVEEALESAGLPTGRALRADTGRVAAVLCKAEPSRSGLIRGHRHVMLDDSDIHASRHARALVGGVLAGVFGDTQLFVSGGAEHQGPDGGGPVAVIARRT